MQSRKQHQRSAIPIVANQCGICCLLTSFQPLEVRQRLLVLVFERLTQSFELRRALLTPYLREVQKSWSLGSPIKVELPRVPLTTYVCNYRVGIGMEVGNKISAAEPSHILLLHFLYTVTRKIAKMGSESLPLQNRGILAGGFQRWSHQVLS